VLGGCAAALEREEAADTERLLALAGFRRDESAGYAALPPYEIVARGESGATSYAYADPKGCRCVYVGDRRAYEGYRELAVSEAIAKEMSIGATNAASSEMPAWGTLDPRWVSRDAWD